MNKNIGEAFNSFFQIIKTLRGEGGCPWDIEQTPNSMKEYLLEETYEVIDAIETSEQMEAEETLQKNTNKESIKEHIKEELGDVLLNTVMISYMYEQMGLFSFYDVLTFVCEKLIRRHPHVFGNENEKNTKLSPNEVLTQWEKIKVEKEEMHKNPSILDDIPFSSPLLKTLKLKKRVAKVGFDWDCPEDVMLKLDEEINEIKEAIEKNDRKNIEEEIGDAFFVLVNVADKFNINPELALNAANKKFERRFRYVEQRMKESNTPLKRENLDKMNEYWDKIKSEEKL